MNTEKEERSRPVFVIADNVTSPLGLTTAENFESLSRGISALNYDADNDAVISKFSESDTLKLTSNLEYTFFEKLLIQSISDAFSKSQIAVNDNTGLILSTTKGNIGLLETEPHNRELYQRISLPASAKKVAGHFGFINPPIVVSNACISGVSAILTGQRLIQSGQYETVVVAGADVISNFVLSGFRSFQALSSKPCRPFDAGRDGLNLGEGAATVILSARKKNDNDIKVTGGAISNDANHISGPSRTGKELAYAINQSLRLAGLSAAEINHISAHGTATVYNDEMEAKAVNLAGLQNVPLNSLKSYYGHTLGAAGLIESVMAMTGMKQDVIFASRNFASNGVSTPVNVATKPSPQPVNHILKTASGFGGCNAAIIFSK